MEAKRFHLEGPSLDALKAKVTAEHGPRARIVAAEKVTVGGIRGFFARQHYEVTVEVQPEPPAPETRRARRARFDADARRGIAALLADAEESEALLQGRPAEPLVSTGSDHFAALMDDLTFNTGGPAALTPPPVASVRAPLDAPVPVPLRGVGDLVIVIGLRQDAAEVARSMAAADPQGSPDAVELAGALSSPDWDRRRALQARATAVERSRAAVVAFGLDAARNPAALRVQADILLSLGADQLWVAVDAGRKAQDTALWVNGVAGLLPLDAVAVLGAATTGSPETVTQLSLPVGWVDGAPAVRGWPGQPDKLA